MMQFTIPGKPTGKGRPKFSTATGYVKTYTPKETASYENLVKLEYQRQCGDQFIPVSTPVSMRITSYYQIPASRSKKDKDKMLAGIIRPTVKPDIDNTAKIICDALNGIAYHDDAQIVDYAQVKLYSEIPRVEVKIWPL